MDDITEEEKIIICSQKALSAAVSAAVLSHKMSGDGRDDLIAVLERFTAELNRLPSDAGT